MNYELCGRMNVDRSADGCSGFSMRTLSFIHHRLSFLVNCGRKGIPRLYFKTGQKKGFLKNNLWQKGRFATKHVLLPPFLAIWCR